MDARPFLAEIAGTLQRLRFDVVLIGNAAAALQGAPVTTVDFDFLFRKTPTNLRKLKALAASLGATVLRPYYPASDLYRVVRDDDGLQLDFMVTIHGLRSFSAVRARAETVDIDGAPVLVASLVDIIKSKRAEDVQEISLFWMFWRRRMKKRKVRREKLAALRRESDRALVELIRRRLALPPERRTAFLRKRVTFRGTAL